MPTYDYQCQSCHKEVEFFHGMNETPELECPHCGHKHLEKLVSGGAGIVFKGSGFYETDYKRAPEKTESTPAPSKSACGSGCACC